MGVNEFDESSLFLDDMLLRLMEQLQLLDEKRAALNSLTEQGWFSLSKARYAMGNKQVSALQYASQMEPLVCVHARTLVKGEVDFCTERLKQTSKETGQELKTIEDIGPQEEGIRRRNTSKKDTTQEDESKNATITKSPVITSQRQHVQNPQQDPLKWFGILLPQSLKHAQSSFKQVIELSAEIATLQSAVLSTRQELREAIKDHHNLQAEATAVQLDQAAE